MERKNDTESRMSTTVDWKNEIETLAPPFRGNRKVWFSQAARRAGVSVRSLMSLYYGEVTDPRHSVGSGILEAAREAREEAARIASIYREILGEENGPNENLSGKDVAALVGALNALGSVDRT